LASPSIGTTDNHPFWSEDRREYVPAGELRVGENLRTVNGSRTYVQSIRPRGPPEDVYNLEVEGAHTYHVGTTGVLVHNMCIQANKAAGDAARDQIAKRTGGATEATFITKTGARRSDVLVNGSEIVSIESKVGLTKLSRDVRRQLAKDWQLLRLGPVDRVIWEFSRSGKTGLVGPTQELMNMLKKLGFDVIINP